MEDIIKIFHIDWKLIVAQFVNFGIVFGVLYWFGLRKVAVLMDERSKTIAEGVANAEKTQIIREQAQEEKAEILKLARTEAEDIVSSAREDASKKIASAKKEADEKGAAIIALAETEAQAKKDAVIADSRKTIIGLAVSLARKTFQELGVEEQSEIAKSAIKKIEKDM